MLAHNKPAGYVKEQEHGHARFTQPQPLPQPLQQWWLREHSSWGHHSEYDEQRHGPQHQDDHSKHRSGYNVSPSSMHSSPVCIGQTGSSPTEVASITIHPTIANMVSSPASLCSAPSSPPQLSPYRALAPAPSPPHPSASSSSCPRNVSESPEMESNLQQHDQHHPSLHQNKHALVTERRPLLPSPLPAPPLSASHPPRFRDEIMMDMTLDHPTVAELSSSPSPDSRMDLCEPEHPPQQVLRGWSWSSSSSSSSTTQTNSSPSPPIDHSCVRPLPYQPNAVSYHLKDGEQQHANQQQRHNEHRQYPDQRAYNYQQYSQAPPWPEHHQLKQQLQRRSRHANHTTLRESTVTAGPSVRQRPPTVYPSKKSRTSPMSFPEGHSLNASPPGLPQRKSCPVISTSSRTPTLERPSSSHGPNMHPALVLRDQEEGDSSSPPRPDRDQRRRSIALPLPKNYELMSAAQKMLYERHPPSPKNERYPASSTPSPSTTASSHPSSPSSPSSNSDGSCPPTSPGLAMSMTSKDGTERIADRTQERYSERLPPLLHPYEFTSEHNRLPIIGHHPSQKQQQQQQHHHPHHQQQQQSERPGNLLQDPPPKLPSLSSFAFPRARHPHSAQPTELSNRRNSSSRALTSLFPSSSSSSTSAAMTLSSLSLAPAPTNNGANGSGHLPCRDGSKAGATHRDLKRSNSRTGSSPPGQSTEGTPIIRNEDGAIMVYNPLTESMTFRCELCPGESFGRIHDLKRHQTSKHQEMTWPCDFCHRPFVRRDALLRHYTVKAARDDGLHPASHEVERLLAARARAKMLY